MHYTYDAHVRAYWRHRLELPAKRYRSEFAAILTYRRLASVPDRGGAAAAIFREGLADIIALRLRAAYMPIFETLARIEGQLAILAASGRDRWAPPPIRPVMPAMVRNELPAFLRTPRSPR